MFVKIDDRQYEIPDEVAKRMDENYRAMTTIAKKYDELGFAVQDMRNKQKLYFSNRKAFNLLDDAKAAEKTVDMILSGKSTIERVEATQHSLF